MYCEKINFMIRELKYSKYVTPTEFNNTLWILRFLPTCHA